jgi:hypothetical protein
MSFNTTQIEKLVDPFWRESIQETDEHSASLWDFMQKSPTENANTLGQKWKVRTGYNESESWAAFNGQAFAQGGNSAFKNLFVPYRTVSKQGLITKEAIDNDDGKSKYHPVVQEFESALSVGMKQVNRALALGDGTGRIGVLSANYAGGSPTLVTTAPNTTFGNKGAQFIKPGKKIQIADPTGVTVRNGTVGAGPFTVSSLVLATGVITLSSNGPSDAVTNDIVVPEGAAGRGMHGLEYWVKNSGNLFELALATDPGLRSTIVSGASGTLMLLIEQMFSAMAHYIDEEVALGINGQEKHCFFWSPTQREKYRKEAQGLGITMLGSSKIDTGYVHTEEINGYTFKCSKDHSNNRINCLKKSDWYRISRGGAEKPFERYRFNGQALFNKYDSTGNETSGMGFIMTGYVNVACRNVRNQAAITSLPTSGLQTGN